MALVGFSIALLIISSLISVFVKDEVKRAFVACFGTAFASISGIFSVIVPTGFPQELTISTNIPGVVFSFGVDPLSSFFLVVIFGISFFAAIYGFGYIKEQRRIAATVPFFPLLVASMCGVVVSKDGFSFLILWELMSVFSFFLVTTEHENKDVQKAGYIYLIATHLATLFLMVFFILLFKNSGSFLFSDIAAHKIASPVLGGILFLFAVIGFGTKAGIFPFHVWLPHAHPAAPSYISAIMSGVMIKTGIYGILRALTFFDAPPVWWGAFLIVLGVLSAVLGVLYAIMQHDLKKLLAYHSVENIGIIVIGIGLGIIGISKGNNLLVILGFGGAIFHTLNHAVFKGLLFLCAGIVAHKTHTLAIDRLGGLIKKMPVTAATFLIAALSICGLPPFNGFISEWLVYIGLLTGAQSFSGYPVLLSAAGILGIAFAGGLAVLCFTKVFGVVFLGEARVRLPEDCTDPVWFFKFPVIFLAALCLLIGLFSGTVLSQIFPAVQVISPSVVLADTLKVMAPLNIVNIVFIVFVLLIVSFLLLRRMLFAKKQMDASVTWDCGYETPRSTMQYTASSFAEPVGTFFAPLLKATADREKQTGVFPNAASFSSHVDDCAEKGLFDPFFNFVGGVILFIRNKKKSSIQSYLSLIFIVLIILFVLEVWFGI